MTLLRGLAVGALVVVLSVGVLLAAAPVRDVQTSVTITASPAQVWAVLADTRQYEAWNPDNRLVGRLQAGQVIEHDEGEGADMWVFHPVVLAAKPGVELRWFGRVWFWHIFDADHYFLLQPDGAGTRLLQGEHVRGVALWFFDVGELTAEFGAVNAALKRRAEAQK